jgi:hypothetical protein
VLRKDANGTSMVAIAKHLAIHTQAMPKYIARNLRRPKLVWVPSKSGWLFIGTMALEAWFNGIIIIHHMLIQVIKLSAYPNPIPSENWVKSKSYNIQVSYSSCGDSLELFDGLQIIKLKLATNDHELIKVSLVYLIYLGAYELIELDIYAYVACNETFEWI